MLAHPAQPDKRARTLRLLPISNPVWVDAEWLRGHVSKRDDDCLPLLCPQRGSEKPCKRRYIYVLDMLRVGSDYVSIFSVISVEKVVLSYRTMIKKRFSQA